MDALTALEGVTFGTVAVTSRALAMVGLEVTFPQWRVLVIAGQAGESTSVSEIATRLGDVHRAREVGQAMAHNRFPIIVPCHRVLAANGKLGGFSAPGGVATKQRLLDIERAAVSWQLPLV